jgi:phosphatidylglycerophosphatase C
MQAFQQEIGLSCMNPSSIAVFDFDETIISQDSLIGYIGFLLDRNPLRRYAAGIVSIIRRIFEHSIAYRKALNSIILWLATVGLDSKKLDNLTREFIDSFLDKPGGAYTYPQAVERLKWHASQQHQIVILSASIDRYIKLFLSRIMPDIDCLIIGSTEKWMLGGTVLSDYCSGSMKIPLAYQAGLPQEQWGYAYTDSARDLPMLAHAGKRFLINPSQKSIDIIRKNLGQTFEVIHW